MNRLKLSLILLAFALLISSCGKYDDGPFFSIYSKTERVTGYWFFDLVKEGGVDKTEDYIQHTLELYKNGTAVWNKGYQNNDQFNPIMHSGTWQFRNNKENILMKFNTLTPEAYKYDWTIKRLAYADMRLERYDDVKGKIEWRLWKR